jgi:hypothetical protein
VRPQTGQQTRQRIQLGRAGLADRRSSLLQMVLPDPQLAYVLALQYETAVLAGGEKRDRLDIDRGLASR